MTTKTICANCHNSVPDDAPSGLCPECLLRSGLLGVDETTYVPTPQRKQKAQPPRIDELAAAFPNLEILEFVGAGGMGSVYKARQKSLDRVVALKVLHREFASDPAFAERFAREARTMAKLDHPHIVGVFESGQAGDYYFLLMEYVSGTTLRAQMANGSLDPAAALVMAPRICEALEYAHSQGVVHRDIKPENILIDAKGEVKIADFGLAKLLGRSADTETLTQPQQVMGTLHYMAPEQLRGAQAVDHRADIYSLGVVIYEMLTGHLPVGRFEPPSQRVAIDVRIDDVVLRSLERDPDRRYQRAGQVKTEIDSICSDPNSAKRLGTVQPRPAKAVQSPELTRFNLVISIIAFLATFLPWGSTAERTKIDHDFHFAMNRDGMSDGSTYCQFGMLDYAVMPEGRRVSAWTSSFVCRLTKREPQQMLTWDVQLPNWVIAIEVLAIVIFLANQRAGRAPAWYVVPVLATAGILQTLLVMSALSLRGTFTWSLTVVLFGLMCCLVVSVTAEVLARIKLFASRPIDVNLPETPISSDS